MKSAAMGRVEAVAIPGMDLWFNSSDHLPPHFHARKPGRWEVRVYILECTEAHFAFSLKWPGRGDGPQRRERRLLLGATLGQRSELLEEWERKVVFEEER